MNIPSEHSSAATPGEQLKQAREQAGLSIELVARNLFLDVQAIQAMESNRFKELGAPVYAKGYLRKYVRLLGLTEEDVLQRYQSLSDAPVVADPIPVAMGSVPESRRPLPRWILWVVIALIVLAALATLWNLRSPSTGTSKQALVISQPFNEPDASITAGSSTAAPESTAVAVNNATGTLNLRFQFSGDSWVEVYDVSNQQVLYDMGAANSTREITAVAPLRVLLGSAGAVKMQVNSQDVVVPSTDVESGVAHFVVNAGGAIE